MNIKHLNAHISIYLSIIIIIIQEFLINKNRMKKKSKNKEKVGKMYDLHAFFLKKMMTQFIETMNISILNFYF